MTNAINKTVFVTGGSGFVGQNLIPILVSKGFTVKALTRSEKSALIVQRLGALPINGDLYNKEAVKKGLKDCTSVFHLAASVDFYARMSF